MSDDLEPKLMQLAEGVLDELLVSGEVKPSLDQRMDALKVIGTLHLGLRRLNGRVPSEEEDTGTTLPAMRAKIASAGEGK